MLRPTHLAVVCLLAGVLGEAVAPLDLEHFDTSLITSLRKSDPKSWVFSPVSIGSVLGMVYVGAGGQTASQLGSSLGLSSDKNVATQQLYALQANLQKPPGNGVTWEMANRILVAKQIELVQNYKTEVSTHFHAEIENADFSQPQAVIDNVNNWVNNSTHGFIKQLLQPGSIDTSTVMVLLNAVYFKGTWKYEFDSKRTHKQCFYSSPMNCKQVDFMTQKRNFKYTSSNELNAQILELPYADEDYSMVIVLPTQQDGLSSVAEKLKTTPLIPILNNMYTTEVNVIIPKFEDEFYKDITSNLQEIGITDLFTSRANLTGMVKGGNVAASSVIHKAKISVTEQGTIAAAATGLVIVPVSAILPPRTVTFSATHPFLYYIKHKESGFLFSGEMLSPV